MNSLSIQSCFSSNWFYSATKNNYSSSWWAFLSPSPRLIWTRNTTVHLSASGISLFLTQSSLPCATFPRSGKQLSTASGRFTDHSPPKSNLCGGAKPAPLDLASCRLGCHSHTHGCPRENSAAAWQEPACLRLHCRGHRAPPARGSLESACCKCSSFLTPVWDGGSPPWSGGLQWMQGGPLYSCYW